MIDSWQHGKDLYEVYSDLLGFSPADYDTKVSFRVTNNQITSQVAGMLINGMLGSENDVRLAIQVMLEFTSLYAALNMCSLVVLIL